MNIPEEFRKELSHLLGIRALFHIGGIITITTIMMLFNMDNTPEWLQILFLIVLSPIVLFWLGILNTTYAYETELEKKYGISKKDENNNEDE